MSQILPKQQTIYLITLKKQTDFSLLHEVVPSYCGLSVTEVNLVRQVRTYSSIYLAGSVHVVTLRGEIAKNMLRISFWNWSEISENHIFGGPGAEISRYTPETAMKTSKFGFFSKKTYFCR